jgi:5-methylcytosine-specific restriction enzyme A
MSQATERIRGRELQRIRRRILRRDPLCLRCLERGFVTASTQVDHRAPLFLGGEESDDNRQGLCDDCHAEKTDEDLANKPKGGDLAGMPTDHRHHWNKT